MENGEEGEERRGEAGTGEADRGRRAERGPSRLLGRRSEAGRGPSGGTPLPVGKGGSRVGGAEWETTVSVEHDVLRKGGAGE